MPFLIPILVIGGLTAAVVGSSAFGTSLGNEAGQGLNTGLTVIGIATGVGIVIYALHKSGKKI